MEPAQTPDAASRASSPLDKLETNRLVATGELDGARDETLLYLANGAVVRIPTALLLQRLSPDPFLVPQTAAPENEIIIPVIEEQLTVIKQTVVTGTVLLQRNTSEHQYIVDEPLVIQTYQTTRIPVDVAIDSLPPVREEGNVTIYPVTEERLIVTKQLFLVEEVHVTRCLAERHDAQTISLRRDDISVIRTPAEELL